MPSDHPLKPAARSADEWRCLAEEYAERMVQYDRVLSSISDFAYTFDLEGRFTFINKPLLDLWGLTLDQAVGKNFFDLKYPDDLAAKLQRQIAQVIDTRQKLSDETPYTSPTGAGGYYQYILTPVIGADGKVEAVAGSMRDITERKQLEADRELLTRTVAGERAKLAGIIEHAPAFICALRGPYHIFELANERYYEIVGRRDIVGKPIREALPEVEGQGYFELLDNVYKTGETFTGHEMPAMLRSEDGSTFRRFMNLVYQPIRDEDGRISGIFVHGVDVTDMVEARESLRKSEGVFRQLADAMPQIVWAAAPDGVLNYYNRRWFEYINLPASAMEDARWDRYIHPDDLQRVFDAWTAAVQSGEQYAIEFRVKGADNIYRWFLVRALPLRNEVGQIERWLGTCTDIDALKQLTGEREQLLERERAARAEAESANRAKDKFLAVLSHELRTPLSPVVMTIPALEMDPDLPFKFREDLAMVRRNIDLEVKLIDDLLDLSRVTSGKLRLQMQPVQIHEVLRHAIHNSLSDTGGKRLNLQQELTARNDHVTADPARLQQVFWNLLRNAVKFTPDGGQITVRTWNTENNSRLCIEVKDSGAGIDPSILPRVFDAFEQGEVRTTRQHGGLGLGLAIAKAVVEMHAGRISADSLGKDQGASFTVQLQTAAERSKARNDGGAPAVLSEDESARVLLVEDHPDTARVLARLLTMKGFDVRTSGSMAAALQLAGVEQFDVVVSDIGLPDATGYELMQQLRDCHGLKGIALSGYGMEEDMRKSREAGFIEHIVKPVDVTQLQAAIHRVANIAKGDA